MAIQSVNPATEQLTETFEPYPDERVDKVLTQASEAFKHLRAQTYQYRAACMNRVADQLESNASSLAPILTEEMGKTLSSAVAEVKKCASVCRHYAEFAQTYLADRPIGSDASQSYLRYLPLGPVLAVMPWNFPFWQVFRFAAPTLMAGNTAVLKHASNVPRSALKIEEIFREAGFEAGVFSTLLIGSDKIESIVRDDRIRAVTLTGSEPAGRSVAAIASDVVKPSLLELGGSDAFIVMPSANLDEAVDAAVRGRTINNGQSCIAAKRFIVHRDVYPAFRAAFVSRFEELIVGDPMDDETDIGPLALSDIRSELDEQVQSTVSKGATVLTGCQILNRPGYYYQPGILEEPPRGSSAFREEVFGPVASLYQVQHLDEAIALANESRFGLGSALYTHEHSDIERCINEIEAGSTFVNSIVASDPRLPFGGIKASGYGRELSAEGIQAFTNQKTISVA